MSMLSEKNPTKNNPTADRSAHKSVGRQDVREELDLIPNDVLPQFSSFLVREEQETFECSRERSRRKARLSV